MEDTFVPKAINIQVTKSSAPNAISPLPNQKCQFLLPEDQINLNQITVANERVTNSIEMEPMIEPLEEVYSVAFLRNAENKRFSRRRSTLLTVLDYQGSSGSSRRDSKSSDFWSFNKRRNSKGRKSIKQASVEENMIEEIQDLDPKKMNGSGDRNHTQPSELNCLS